VRSNARKCGRTRPVLHELVRDVCGCMRAMENKYAGQGVSMWAYEIADECGSGTCNTSFGC